MTKVLISVSIGATALQQLEALPNVIVHVVSPHEKTWDLPDELVSSDLMLCKVPPRNLDAMTNLKLLQLSTVGYEHLNHLKLGERPFAVCNARGVFDTAIAEWNIAMMINLARDLRQMIRNQDLADWERLDRFQQEVRLQVVGLWGYGGIGRDTARLAKALGMTVHVMTRTGVKPRHDTYTPPLTGDPDGVLPNQVFVAGQEKAFLGGLDFLVLALPHTRQSDGLIGEKELRRLAPTAFVLNPARGPIIQEQALLQALKEGWIAGAALDTHFAYPLPPAHPLWTIPNVILTPHISGADKSPAFPTRMGDLFVQNVTRHRAGQSLLNQITAQEWQESY
jgi:phosphoglycerate dehydrogenase-like enzyme